MDHFTKYTNLLDNQSVHMSFPFPTIDILYFSFRI